ncbi:MAG: YfhO family protein [Oscillospiraceae bacterium]|nr:YfhO family protein [Oscillospiraceae bacterium]
MKKKTRFSSDCFSAAPAPRTVSLLAAAAFVLPFFITLCVCALLRMTPFGDSSILTGDLGGQFISFFANFKDTLLQSRSLSFTFSKLLGGSMFNYNIQYLASPLNYLYVLLPKQLYPDIAVVILALRAGFSGLAFFCCVRYIRGTGNIRTLCLSLCYALMGYAAAYFQIPDWHFFILITPVLAASIERFLRERRWGRYAACLAFSVLHSYYIGSMLCLFAGCFFLYRLHLSALDGRIKLRRAASFLGLSALSVGATAFYLLPCVLGAAQDKGGLFKSSADFSTNFEPLQLFSKFTVGSFAWDNVADGLPVLYCGVLGVVLLSLYFQSKDVSKREKLASALVLLCFFLVLWLRPLNLLLHGGSPPNWFPYRYSFLICFFILFLASGYTPRALSPRRLLANVAALALFGALSYLFNENIPSLSRIGLTVFLGCAYLFALSFSFRSTHLQRLAPLCMTAAVCIELSFNLYSTMRVFEYYSADSYRDFVTSWSETLSAIDDDSFYRIEKTEIRSYNDPLLLDYPGNSLFASQTDATQNLCSDLGYERNTYGRGSTVFADALLSFRYILSDSAAHVGPQYHLLDASTAHGIYKSDYTLPLCFSASDAILEDIRCEDAFQYQNAILQALTNTETVYFHMVSYTVEHPTDSSTRVLFTAPEDGFYYALPSDAVSGVGQITVGDTGLGEYGSWSFSKMIQLGSLRAGQSLSVDFDGAAFSQDDLRLCVLNAESFNAAYRQLLSCGMRFETIRDGYVSGTVSAQTDGVLFTTLLYSDGWEITVNGESAQGEEALGCLLTVPLRAGENTVELCYTPPGLRMGTVVTAASAAFLLLLAWLEARKKAQPAQ